MKTWTNIGARNPDRDGWTDDVLVDGIAIYLTGRCSYCYGLRRFTYRIRMDDLDYRLRDVAWACKECKRPNVSKAAVGMITSRQKEGYSSTVSF